MKTAKIPKTLSRFVEQEIRDKDLEEPQTIYHSVPDFRAKYCNWGGVGYGPNQQRACNRCCRIKCECEGRGMAWSTPAIRGNAEN